MLQQKYELGGGVVLLGVDRKDQVGELLAPSLIDHRTGINEAKARIRLMDFRFVEENHPIKQCILQIYTAIALETPYNNFDTH